MQWEFDDKEKVNFNNQLYDNTFKSVRKGQAQVGN